MVSHMSKPSHAPSNSRSSQASSNTPGGHSKKSSSSSNHNGQPREREQREPREQREQRPSREGTAQKAAQDVAGLKDYQLGDCLGKGAFGSVYRALNWGTGETVAIKQVRLENLGAADLKNMEMEIDLLKNLNHPNIVKYHGFVRSSESLYIILEYCENGSLHSICKNFGKFPENLVALYMSQVLHGLLYLHEQGVIHRDIKGANILTTKEGLVKLADFGVATKQSGLDQSSVVGTPYWMAPEVIELSGATTSSDIWSLGCTVIELIEGKPPYHKLQPMQALFRIVNDEHPPIPGSASPLLREFLMECFQKNPTLRISAKRLLKHPWILSAKRTVPAVPTKPTEYQEAVKSVQEWNEALKSPNSLRRSSRLSGVHRSSPAAANGAGAASRRAPAHVNLNISKHRPTAESFRSPELDHDDNWDNDFAESISPRALQMPHLKPQDNFGGLFSGDKLKAFASFESVTEMSEFGDGETTVKSPMSRQQYQSLPKASGQRANERAQGANGKAVSTGRSSRSTSSATDSEYEDRHDVQPRTAFLRGTPRSAQPLRPRPAAPARPSQLFREDTVEDYSDLMPTDEGAFERKLASMQYAQPPAMLPKQIVVTNNNCTNNNSPSDTFSPRLFHPSDLKAGPKATRDLKSGGNIHQRSASSTSNRKLQRTQSEIEIQKYAEDEGDDFSDVFGDIKGHLANPSRAESDSGSEHSSLAMITSKMANSFIIADEDDLDPFANLDEGLDNINLENNVARDRDDRLTKMTEGLVGCLKTSQPDDELLEIADQLLQVLHESPDKRSIILRSHGMLPILEILGTRPHNEVVLPLLKIINLIILEDAESQESLSFLGGIPTICYFASKKFPSDIRKEAAAFVRQMYQTSTLTLQMFIGCGGINVLVEFLEEDIDAERDLVLIGVNGVFGVFELQGPTPKNDFCRIFSRSSVLYPLSLVLNRMVEEDGEVARLIVGRIVQIFLIFSQAESHVKDLVADRMILKRVLKDLRKMAPPHQITMLKFIKNLSSLSSTHEALQNSNAIDILIELLKSTRQKDATSRSQNRSASDPKRLPPFHREISNQILNTMYNLCRHNKSRQEEAALSDIIPLLKEVVREGGPLKEFALPVLLEMVNSGKVARKMLWDAKGLAFYVSLLGDRNWAVTALDAIFVWLQEETARVEQYLLSSQSSFTMAVISAYTSADLPHSTFENMLEPLQKVVRLSPPIAASLAVPEIFSRTEQKLGHKDAVTRLNFLRILRTICDAKDEGCWLVRAFGCYERITWLMEHDSAVLVRQMAEELVRACDEVELSGINKGSNGKRSVSRASAAGLNLRRPASSAGGRRDGSGSSTGSTLIGSGMGLTPPTPNSLKNTFMLPPMSGTPTSLGSGRDRITRSQSSTAMWDLAEDPTTALPPPPSSGRSKPPALARSSTSFAALQSNAGTPTHSRTPSRPPSRDAATSLARIEANKSNSRLPKARQGRLSEAVIRRRQSTVGENDAPGNSNGGSSAATPTQAMTPTAVAPHPLPRLQIVRRRRETSGGEMSTAGRPKGTAAD
ncbi:ste ste11 cdc15 protein kinase [Stemphylium lycopersici]|uniref:non-specific serine/threonine protein kinase n=1 Tax=Stemphylium lycopersici TaxID=183478 RepID=A0A364N5U3_STELY|nr:ste ste11 cdc15 protein kinase [Stemphylium lycopersici]RAR12479.1 ste ste11 cdc15 protein kinase [Stemphylium lycopersici]RAR12636.1 ste ste11 cdc15 protein kinase [Stemphylium lycopersici]